MLSSPLTPDNLKLSALQTKLYTWADQALFIFLCIGVFFLPRSIAIINSAAFLMLLAFLVKRSVLCSAALRLQKSAGKSLGIGDSVKTFLVSFKPVDNPIGWRLLVLGGFILLSLAANGFEPIGLRKFFSRYLKEIYLFFLTIEALNSGRRLYWFFGVLSLSVLLISSDGIYQYFTHHGFLSDNIAINGRVTGAFRHSNDFGSYLVTVLPLLFCFQLLKGKMGKELVPFTNKWMVSVLFFCALFLLGATFSRGAWIGFFCSMLFLLIVDKELKFMRILPYLIGFFALFFAFAPIVRHDLIPSYTDWGDFFRPNNRLIYWKPAFALIGSSPLFGVGFGDYVGGLKRMELEPLEYPHNGFLHIVAEIGLFGLGAFLLVLKKFIGHTLRQAVRLNDATARKLIYGLLAGIFGFWVHSFFDTGFTSIKLICFMWIMMGVTIAVSHVSQNEKGVDLQKGA